MENLEGLQMDACITIRQWLYGTILYSSLPGTLYIYSKYLNMCMQPKLHTSPSDKKLHT